jgi:hypothetical protein
VGEIRTIKLEYKVLQVYRATNPRNLSDSTKDQVFSGVFEMLTVFEVLAKAPDLYKGRTKAGKRSMQSQVCGQNPQSNCGLVG